MRFLFVSLLLVTIFYFLSGRALFRAEIIFFNVGQGDSFALRTPGGKVIGLALVADKLIFLSLLMIITITSLLCRKY